MVIKQLTIDRPSYNHADLQILNSCYLLFINKMRIYKGCPFASGLLKGKCNPFPQILWDVITCSSWAIADPDDIMAGIHFPQYWHFVYKKHRSPRNYTDKGQVMVTFGILFVVI